MLRNTLAHEMYEIRAGELPGANIDRQMSNERHPNRQPRIELTAGAIEYPATDEMDQAGFLGHGYERVRRNIAQLRMVPAQQRHGPDHPAADVELRLEIQRQFVVGDGSAQAFLQL